MARTVPISKLHSRDCFSFDRFECEGGLSAAALESGDMSWGLSKSSVTMKRYGNATVTVADDDGNMQTVAVSCKPTDFKLYQHKYTYKFGRKLDASSWQISW